MVVIASQTLGFDAHAFGMAQGMTMLRLPYKKAYINV